MAETEYLAWHQTFIKAIQMELDDYGDQLLFIPEHQLTKEPLRIDVVINVYGNVYIYLTLNDANITDLTLTFISSRYPGELINHLQKIHHFTVEERSAGIYNVHGDILPIQIIDSRKLSLEENIWLGTLNNRLEIHKIQGINKIVQKWEKPGRIRAYLDVIIRANREIFEEAMKMRKKYPTLEQISEEAGLLAEWEARGVKKGEVECEMKGEMKKAVKIAKIC